jgi:hypothetical protein
MTEAIRQRVRDILEPFMTRFDFDVDPGASLVQISDVCQRLRLQRLLPAVDEYLRICGSPEGPAHELFAGEDPFRVDVIIEHGWHNLKVARIWGASSDLVAEAVPYSGNDYAVTWLRSPDSRGLFQSGDLEIWWAREDGVFGRDDLGFFADLEQRVRWALHDDPRATKRWPDPRPPPPVDVSKYRNRDWIGDIANADARSAIRDQLDRIETSVAEAVAAEDTEQRQTIRHALLPLLTILTRAPLGASREEITGLCKTLSIDSLRPDVDEYLLLVGNDDELGKMLFPEAALTVAEIQRHKVRIDSAADEVSAVRLPQCVPLPGLGTRGGWITLHGDVWELTDGDYDFVSSFCDLVQQRAQLAIDHLRTLPPI